ncbi:MAG: PQQ-binding-like beta-propeller repeat protein, partial [Anaerolineae bacterium]|nr:PQQ-binding-like beta-propeller repeat protein [Anaerolineae bacterium]
MTNHLTHEQLIGYIHQTLTDAEREEIDRHLAECAQCRNLLTDHETTQRRIQYGLNGDLRKMQPSARMSFAAIAPRLKRRRGASLILFWTTLDQPVSGAVALTMLVALTLGLFFIFTGKTPPPETSVAGSMFRGNPQHTGAYHVEIVPSLGEVAWSFDTDDRIWTSPAIADNLVYFSSMNGYVYALDSQIGQLVWKQATGGASFSSPAVVDGLVYVGFGNYLYALDGQTGQKRWSFKTEGYWTNSPPTVADGLVYFGSGPYLYALDAQTGQKKWS